MTNMNERICVRIDGEKRRLIEEVAEEMGISLSAFVVMSAVQNAKNYLKNQTL